MRIYQAHNVKHMLQTARANQNQSLQQELAIFHVLPTASILKFFFFCKNLNVDTHSNPDKNSLTVDSETRK
jgi:hypothetical protein